MISVKKYKHGEETLITACDENLIGKKFTEGKFQIDVTKKFYDGMRVDKKTLIRFLKTATIANLVGEETIKYAIECGIIDPENVLRVKGVPHAQMVKML